ncbi:hypothetical protein GW746_01120 [Candidatus Saccharibacteria bacterium]|nr:hypothetical protein [Candidatus Saccharibacteria bacterium]NCS83001.1 hypothetical protein [Candidatus Saccharibacteria bacterium]
MSFSAPESDSAVREWMEQENLNERVAQLMAIREKIAHCRAILIEIEGNSNEPDFHDNDGLVEQSRRRYESELESLQAVESELDVLRREAVGHEMAVCTGMGALRAS